MRQLAVAEGMADEGDVGPEGGAQTNLDYTGGSPYNPQL
jgi:hypothetical protein